MRANHSRGRSLRGKKHVRFHSPSCFSALLPSPGAKQIAFRDSRETEEIIRAPGVQAHGGSAQCLLLAPDLQASFRNRGRQSFASDPGLTVPPSALDRLGGNGIKKAFFIPLPPRPTKGMTFVFYVSRPIFF